MRQKLYLFLLAAWSFSTAATAQVFVNSSATGANTGASWADAFTTLDTAIKAASPSAELWIATGNYTPKAAAAIKTSTFLIDKPLSLFGGFVGNETALTQRNPAANLTVLSGDLGGDDVAGDFWTNRANNAWHIATVQGILAGSSVVFDGLRVSGGRADSSAATAAAANARGAGIHALSSTIEVVNCVFSNNWARSGACIWNRNPNANGSGSGSDSKFIDCVFENNANAAQSAGLFAENVKNIEITHCDFRNNTTVRGAMYLLGCQNATVSNCVFENNKATAIGAAAWTWACSVDFSNCEFLANESNNGNIYCNGQDAPTRKVHFSQCKFEGNKALGTNARCGGLYLRQVDGYIDDCYFLNNSSDFSVGGLYMLWCPVSIKRTRFEGNMAGAAGNGWGGAGMVFHNAASYAAGHVITFDSCEFKLNEASQSGGALLLGTYATGELLNCNFEANKGLSGGCVFVQNDSTKLIARGTVFSGNESTNGGGAINCIGSNPLEIENCLFEFNSSAIGAAISQTDNADNLSTSSIKNTVFYFNTAAEQAGALNYSNIDAVIENCLFSSNTATDPGVGGCISNNAADSLGSNLTIINSTFANNLGFVGSAIAQWEQETQAGAEALLTVQNCIFADALDSYANEPMGGTPTSISIGGNHCLDNSMTAFLTATNDVSTSDPLFVDGGNDNFLLLAGSPCIDKGIKAGAPTTDLLGNPRDSKPDKGAYEFGVIGTWQPLKVDKMAISPNPSDGLAELLVENEMTGEFTVRIFNTKGQTMVFEKVEKEGLQFRKNYDATLWPAGTYIVSVQKDQRSVGRAFVKN